MAAPDPATGGPAEAGGHQADEHETGGHDSDGRNAGDPDADEQDTGGTDADGQEAGNHDAGGQETGGTDGGGRETGDHDADGHGAVEHDAGPRDDDTLDAPTSPARALATLLLRPRRFFRTVVQPGEQGPALLAAMAVVAVEEATRMALVPGAVPGMADAGPLAAAFWLGVAVVVVTPVALHLLAALQTLLLVPFVRDRGGVAETVQVLAYATAPCALAGVPVPELRLLATAWGAALLVVGVSEVHGPGLEGSFVLSAPASALVFGYGFRGFDALATLLSGWYII